MRQAISWNIISGCFYLIIEEKNVNRKDV